MCVCVCVCVCVTYMYIYIYIYINIYIYIDIYSTCTLQCILHVHVVYTKDIHIRSISIGGVYLV